MRRLQRNNKQSEVANPTIYFKPIDASQIDLENKECLGDGTKLQWGNCS